MESGLADSHARIKKLGNCSPVARFKHSLKYLAPVPGTLAYLCEFGFGQQMCYVDRMSCGSDKRVHLLVYFL